MACHNGSHCVTMALLSPLYVTTTPSTNETRAIYFFSFHISSAGIAIGSWIYVKRTHTAPTWLIAFWVNSISVFNILDLLAFPNAPDGFIQIAIIIAVIVCKVHIVNLTVPVTAILIFCYNSTLGRMGAPYPLMMLPGGRDLTPGELVTPFVVSIACRARPVEPNGRPSVRVDGLFLH